MERENAEGAQECGGGDGRLASVSQGLQYFRDLLICPLDNGHVLIYGASSS